VVLAGGGGGTLHPGQHVKLKISTPMTNLYVSMLQRMGVTADRVGDSSGRLEEI